MDFKLIQYINTEDCKGEKSFALNYNEMKLNEMKLSVCLKTNGFSFTFIDSSFHLRAVGEFAVDLSQGISTVMTSIKECFASIDIKNLKFTKTNIINLTNKQVWIPYKLYDSQHDKTYIKTMCDVQSSETILAKIVEAIDAVSIFALPLNHYSGAKIAIPTAKFLSQHEVLARYLFDVASFSSNTFLLYKRDNIFDMLFFKGNTFTFCNSFICENATDMIYYILYALSRLHIDVEDVNFLITGDSYSKEEFNTLRNYLFDVSFANPLENVKAGFEFDGVDLQKYFLCLV
ncbi:MAG: DUF3822 family protein [Bacteroidales bacterium]|jgi:hypothetical protein|nr:DUF3822 family protein [Bacteroidales bacterium]